MSKFIASKLQKTIARRRSRTDNQKQLVKDLRGVVRQQATTIEEQAKKLADWEHSAKAYAEANLESYNAARAADERARQVEIVLHNIKKLILFGDRGMLTTLRQIETIVDEHLDSIAEKL